MGPQRLSPCKPSTPKGWCNTDPGIMPQVPHTLLTTRTLTKAAHSGRRRWRCCWGPDQALAPRIRPCCHFLAPPCSAASSRHRSPAPRASAHVRPVTSLDQAPPRRRRMPGARGSPGAAPPAPAQTGLGRQGGGCYGSSCYGRPDDPAGGKEGKSGTQPMALARHVRGLQPRDLEQGRRVRRY